MVNLFFFGILKVCLCRLKMLFENIFCEFILHKLKLWIFHVLNIPIIFAFIIVAFSSDWYRKLEDFALSEQLCKISSINDIRLWDIPKLLEKKSEPVKVSLALKIRPLTDSWFIIVSNVTCIIFIHLVIFFAVCWEIWQVHLFVQIHINLWFDWMTTAWW